VNNAFLYIGPWYEGDCAPESFLALGTRSGDGYFHIRFCLPFKRRSVALRDTYSLRECIVEGYTTVRLTWFWPRELAYRNFYVSVYGAPEIRVVATPLIPRTPSWREKTLQ
jgi:hypothetical protein